LYEEKKHKMIKEKQERIAAQKVAEQEQRREEA
jgi:hypothetical protein